MPIFFAKIPRGGDKFLAKIPRGGDKFLVKIPRGGTIFSKFPRDAGGGGYGGPELNDPLPVRQLFCSAGATLAGKVVFWGDTEENLPVGAKIAEKSFFLIKPARGGAAGRFRGTS